jgi:hypothetical protein
VKSRPAQLPHPPAQLLSSLYQDKITIFLDYLLPLQTLFFLLGNEVLLLAELLLNLLKGQCFLAEIELFNFVEISQFLQKDGSNHLLKFLGKFKGLSESF